MHPHTVFELRRYRLLPEKRDALISLFDKEFVEPQEALGMRVEGEFRDLDDPDCFVWVRSFEDMEARTAALASFYSGPIWKEHGPAANSTMLNSDNVLLLRPATDFSPFPHNLDRDAEAQRSQATGLVVANICSLAPGTAGDFAMRFRDQVLPVLQDAGARVDGLFVTESRQNGFPRLPVREGETVFVWFECHKDQDSAGGCRDRMRRNPVWTREIYPWMDSQCWRKIETARLAPTARSLCTW